MNYWIFKTEPDEFSIDDLKNCKNKGAIWDGVRNYQARNFLRDKVAANDSVLIYHSSCKNVGVAGIAKVTEVGLADPSAFDTKSKYYDPKSKKDNPTWFTIKLKWVKTLDRVILLKELKAYEELSEAFIVKKGVRLSLGPITKEEYDFILNLV